MLTIMVTCGKRRSHKYKDKRGYTVHKGLIKSFLNVLTSLSTSFLQCMCGGTSCNCMSESSNITLDPLILHYPRCGVLVLISASLIYHKILL